MRRKDKAARAVGVQFGVQTIGAAVVDFSFRRINPTVVRLPDQNGADGFDRSVDGGADRLPAGVFPNGFPLFQSGNQTAFRRF